MQPQAGHSIARPGQMTAVMRALQQPIGPKVLRIGIVRAGRVVEERVVKHRTHVTVGPHEKNMFVVNDRGLPASFRLFDLIGAGKKGGGDYCLTFFDGMPGRIATKIGVMDLEQLKQRAVRGAGGAYQLPLTEDARGKIAVGDVTFLFQFVAPPPVAQKPQLPMSVQSGISSQIDWRLTIIAAFSFLFHFGAVGMLYSDWMDPVVNEDVAIAGLLDSVRSIPPPPPIENPETPEATNQQAAEVAAESKGGGTGKGRGGGKGGGGAGKAAGMSSSEFNSLSNALDQLNFQTIGALTGTGTATAGVLDSGVLPTGALEASAASGAGVGSWGGSGLNIGGGGGGAIRPGASGGGGLQSIGQTGGGEHATAGVQTKVEGPKAQVSTGASIMGGQVSNAQSVVSRMGAAFRRCYTNGLNSDPNMSGKVTLTARIGPNGEVQSVSVSTSGTISGDVAQCIANRLRSAQFDPPEGGTATISIPVTLIPQK